MRITRWMQITLWAAIVLAAVDIAAAPRRRALLVGINDYTASTLGARARTTVPDRDWANLRGAVADVGAMQQMLVLLYGFQPSDIVTLTDQQATRAAILQSLDQHLVRNAAKDDTLFFYFAGHGSQVRNSLSDETDKLDESIVPADSRGGSADIRDKELRSRFNQMLERGARLTAIFDSCHSGSGARGLPTGARARGINSDLRDVRDGSLYGARPEELGAVIISATQDFDAAWETRDRDGQYHGAFTWAWLRTIRDAPAGEPVVETFLRAQARLRGETPYQDPVLGAARPESRLNPFLGVRTDRLADRTVVGVEKVRADGTIVLRGGWANGLSVGSELQVLNEGRATVRVEVTALNGLAQAEARIVSQDRTVPAGVKAGALAEVVGWTAPATRPLRVWMPRVAVSVKVIDQMARSLAAAADRRGVRWVSSPVDVTPTHLLRRGNMGWELFTNGAREAIGTDASAVAVISRIPAGSSLFVQFPAPVSLVEPLGVGAGSEHEGVQPIDRPEQADYMLVGRFSARRLSYAWVRPGVLRDDKRKTGLPVRTDWIAQDGTNDRVRQSVAEIRAAVLRLRKIHAWNLLESPPASRYPYVPAIRRDRDGELLRETVVIGGEVYRLVLRARNTPLLARTQPRFVYVFSIDSFGKSTLLFPRSGSVENRFPRPQDPNDASTYPPTEIALGKDGAFAAEAPYGIDTYFLLSTDEPLPNPWILEWDGVRSRDPQPLTRLEQLLQLVESDGRSTRSVAPANWSIERVLYESSAPRSTSAGMRKQRAKGGKEK